MKAIQVTKQGGTEVLEVNNDEATPTIKEDQILVEVRAAALNPFDVKIRTGEAGMPVEFPYIAGGDFAGVVKEVGENVSDFRTGDEVFGSALTFNGGSGAFAELAAVDIKRAALKPQKLDFVESSSLVLVGSSVVQALEEHIKLQKGQKILIHGGAGGIGSIALQLAKHLGAYVATTVSTDDIEFAKSLGADEIIDYRSQKFEDILKDFDAVYDTVGGETTDRSFKVLKKGGVIVSMVGAPKEELAKEYEVIAIGQGTHTNKEHLQRVAKLVDQGAIKPQVAKVFSLDEIKEAFDYLETGSPKGKVVLKIKH